MKIITAAAIAALAGAANAQFAATDATPANFPSSAVAPQTAEGDLAETALTAFNTNNAAFFDDPIFHEIGTVETFPNATFLEVESSVTDNGDGTRTLDISWRTNDATAIFGPDAFGDGEGITELGFELGVNNVPNDFVEDPDYVSLAEPEDSANPGTFLADFTLLDAAGGVLFDGDFFTTDFGTGFGGITVVNAGGADLGTFNIGGATASITYNIPAPGAASIIGLAGLAAARRRR